jgi:hypothetical protein
MPLPSRAPRAPRAPLITEITRQTSLPVAAEADVFLEALHERFGASLAGVLLYGSGLHDGDLTSGLVDFYVLVDSYAEAYPGRSLRVANAILPPNVFYLEIPAHDPPLQAKYAVMSVDHFERGCSRWFHPYLWARFAQPARLIYCRDACTGDRIQEILAHAVIRFLSETVLAYVPEGGDGPDGPDTPDAKAALTASTLWSTGLRLAYASELRTEKNRAQVLTKVNDAAFERLTTLAAPLLSPHLESVGDHGYRMHVDRSQRQRARLRWRLRRWQGRVLSILRLLKAAFTFDRGADYLAWKVQRHTGVDIEVTPALRRYPILFGPKVLWRLLRGGKIR